MNPNETFIKVRLKVLYIGHFCGQKTSLITYYSKYRHIDKNVDKFSGEKE